MTHATSINSLRAEILAIQCLVESDAVGKHAQITMPSWYSALENFGFIRTQI